MNTDYIPESYDKEFVVTLNPKLCKTVKIPSGRLFVLIDMAAQYLSLSGAGAEEVNAFLRGEQERMSGKTLTAFKWYMDAMQKNYVEDEDLNPSDQRTVLRYLIGRCRL